jgi:iron complex transport system permease protein
MPTRHRAFLVIGLLALLAIVGMLASLAAGALAASPAEVLAALAGSGNETLRAVVLELRLPRTVSAFACGGLLALAGALMQVLLRNPLADPYVLGVSGGASVAAMLAILFGLPHLGVTALSFLGAAAATLLVFGLAHGEGSWTQARLLLTGVVVASGCGAVVALLLSIAPDNQLHGMLFWLMGDLANAIDPWPALAALFILLAGALPLARELNLLARGDRSAQALGVEVKRLRRLIYLGSALATGVAVTTAGSIGFVGLIVPHLVRLALGNDQRLLLPAATLGGGALLVFADTVARTAIAPQQLPVGVLTALIGVPLFLYMLSRQTR